MESHQPLNNLLTQLNISLIHLRKLLEQLCFSLKQPEIALLRLIFIDLIDTENFYRLEF